MKKMILATITGQTGKEIKILVDENEIKQYAQMDNCDVIQDATTRKDITNVDAWELQDEFDSYCKEHGAKPWDMIHDFIASKNWIASGEDVEEIRDALCYDHQHNVFFDLTVWDEPADGIALWDGHNNVVHWTTQLDDINISADCIGLDDWDGRNMSFGGMGYHASVHLATVWDSAADDWKTVYVVNHTSQRTGEIDTAEIIEIADIEKWLSENDRLDRLAGIKKMGEPA